jgi:hypothetical protein
MGFNSKDTLVGWCTVKLTQAHTHIEHIEHLKSLLKLLVLAALATDWAALNCLKLQAIYQNILCRWIFMFFLSVFLHYPLLPCPEHSFVHYPGKVRAPTMASGTDNILQCSAVQCSAVQCSAAQSIVRPHKGNSWRTAAAWLQQLAVPADTDSAVQCSAVQCSAVQCRNSWHLCQIQATAFHFITGLFCFGAYFSQILIFSQTQQYCAQENLQ